MNRFGKEEVEAVTAVIKSGELSSFFKDFRGGKNVQAFEQEFAEYVGSENAISVSNGTVALEISLKALGIRSGDEVITTPLTFIATSTAILSVGAKPVYVDIDPETLCMDPAKIEEAITNKTRAIVPVSLLGYPMDMKKLIRESRGIPVVEDSAQALGASHDNKKIGTYGDLGTFSFQETKNISTLGEGGMIVTDVPSLAEKCRNIRNHGNAYGSINNYICTNARMTEAQAAFGRVQLQKIDEYNFLHRQNAFDLMFALKNIAGLNPVYRLSDPRLQGHIFMLVPMLHGYGKLMLNTRDEFLEVMKQKGISEGVPGQNVGYYKKLMYHYPVVHAFNPISECHWAEIFLKHLVLFDIHRWKTRKEFKKQLKDLKWAK